MTLFKRWNNIVGWAVFGVATLVYLLTIEPVASLWDCSEFIATSYKLEVGHPPGAPLFMLLARLATLFAPNVDYVGIAVNSMNSIASGFCILFLFWTITHLARKLITRGGAELTKNGALSAIAAGAVGALAYTFTDTFWFSAIEGEVYALSSMFTALVVWLMLKWEAEADEAHSLRWIVLIAYLMGLSIGVHILNLLTIPALGLIYYFRRNEEVTLKGIITAVAISFAILIFINNIVIPYTVQVGALIDYLFVNSFDLPVNSGMILFALLLIVGLGFGAWITHRKGKVLANVVLLSMLMIFIGFSSYASVTIRAAANPPMNSNNPNNPYALLSLLNRDQYGTRPLLYGAYYSAPPVGVIEKEVTYLDEDGKYKKANIIADYEYASEHKHLFPRMWRSTKSEAEFKQWSAYRTKVETLRDEKGNIVRDEAGRPIRGEVVDFGRKRSYDDGYGAQSFTEPTFLENLNFFFNYQLSYMYWRYFLWNFVGRQSDIQPTSTTITDGNWLSGIKFIDEAFIGPQDDLPREVEENKGRNKYYFLPFILGVIGMLYQLNRDQRNFTIVMLLFVMTGLALVVFFNTQPSEPRERDYVYAGSFYAFSIWIGLGLLAIYDVAKRLLRGRNRVALISSVAICLTVPTILAVENWDDHDRSGRYIARDIGWNYLQSTLPNSIILNYGDNDTFPIWVNQEMYDVRPDVRVMNTSYLGAEWYIDQMKGRANEAAGIPFSLPKSKYTYANDYVPIVERIDRSVDIKEIIDFVRSDDRNTKVQLSDEEWSDYIPARKISIPVNKQNVLASGIVAEKDRDLIVDSIHFQLRGNSLGKHQLMILDMLANFDWKRPIYMTQVYIFQELGLIDYLQFDGYAYRFVPILTPVESAWDIGRIDADYAAPLLRESYRYGNLSDEDVYVDNFIQHSLSAASARSAFARVAKELLLEGRTDEAMELLDLGLAKLPTSQLRFTDSNTYPFIEGYYAASAVGAEGAAEKGDALLEEYAQSLIEYLDYYLLFEGVQGDMVTALIDDKLTQLGDLYYMAVYAQRMEVVEELNNFYRSLGIDEADLISTDSLHSAESYIQ